MLCQIHTKPKYNIPFLIKSFRWWSLILNWSDSKLIRPISDLRIALRFIALFNGSLWKRMAVSPFSLALGPSPRESKSNTRVSSPKWSETISSAWRECKWWKKSVWNEWNYSDQNHFTNKFHSSLIVSLLQFHSVEFYLCVSHFCCCYFCEFLISSPFANCIVLFCVQRWLCSIRLAWRMVATTNGHLEFYKKHV